MYNNSHPGIEYGDGVLKGPGVPGQVVKLVGNNEFSVVSNAANDAIGILHRTDKDCSAQAAGGTTPCVVDLGEAVIQTDMVTGTAPTAGALLSFDATTAKFKVAASTNKVIARCLAVVGTEYWILFTGPTGEVVA